MLLKNTEIENLILVLQPTIRNSLDINKYRNLSKHSNCWKCLKSLTRDIYKKDRMICKKSFNDNVMYYIKKRYDNE